MTNVRAAFALVALALFAMPTVTAGAVEGRIEAAGLAFAGSSLLEAPALGVVHEGGELPALEISARAVTLHRVGRDQTQVSGPIPALTGDATGNDIDQAVTANDAVLRLTVGAPDSYFALKAGPATGELVDPTLKPVAAIEYGRASYAGRDASSDGQACASLVKGTKVPLCLDDRGVHEIVAASGAVRLTGTLQLLLYGPTLEVTDSAGTTTYTSGVVTADSTGPVERVEDVWIVLVAEDAEATISGQALRWFAAVPTLQGQGVSFDDATGNLRVGARDYRARGQDVETAGALRVALDAAEAGATPPATASGRAILSYADGMSAHVSGDVQRINLQAAPVFTESPAAATGILAALAAAAGATAYYWPRLAFASAALYTRLKQPDILDNEVRNRIYDIVRANPGISAREVHRRSEQSWGTVVYHLRQLERHNLVVSRALGRTRNYYENHGKYRGMEAQLACLQSDRALALARAIVAQPGITQELLAQQTGFPQPTTSYYVRKLKQAALVEEHREGRYTRYFPHENLPRYISISDAPQIGQNAASGVQA